METNYGSSGKFHFLPLKEAERIVGLILSGTDNSIDTSPGYGRAEAILGKLFSGEQFSRITTKISPTNFGAPRAIIDSVELSLEKLRQNSIDAVMLHGGFSEVLRFRDQVMEGLESVLNLGYVKRVGFSAYDEYEISTIRKMLPSINQFQILENIADQRVIKSQVLSDMAKSGIKFQVRSIFLQGKLLQKGAEKLTPEIMSMNQRIDELAWKYNTDRVNVCLEYARTIPWAEDLVVGVDSYANFNQILVAMNRPKLGIENFGTPLKSDMVDPRKW